MVDLLQIFHAQFWQTVQFVHPEYFSLLLLVLLIWAVHVWRPIATDWEQSGQSKSLRFKHPLIDKMIGAKTIIPAKQSWRWVLHLIRLAIAMSLVTALAQPVQLVKLPPEPQTKTVRDIVFVVETSVSMGLQDYEINGEPTSRVNVIQQVLDQFMANLAGNRFGLILFAEQAYTLMPLTSDTSTARLILKRLRPYLAGRTDEAAGQALGLALMQVEETPDSTENRVVVLISDGSTRESRLPLAEVIHYAQGKNIPIYTIGVGANTADADKRQFRGLLYETIESASLKQIAAETGGRYHQVGSGEGLQKVLQDIDRTEGVAIEVPNNKTQSVDFYQYFIAITVMLFVLYFALMQLLLNRLKQVEAS